MKKWKNLSREIEQKTLGETVYNQVVTVYVYDSTKIWENYRRYFVTIEFLKKPTKQNGIYL